MIGLEFICKQENMSYTELANELGVTKQAINNWIKAGRKVPDKQLEKLKTLFTLDEEWFNKELDEDDKVNLYYLIQQNNKVNRNWDLANDETVQEYRIEKMKALKDLEERLDDLYEIRMFVQDADLQKTKLEIDGIFKMIKAIITISKQNKIKKGVVARIIMALIIAKDEKLLNSTNDKFVKMLALAIELENSKSDY